MAQRTPFRENHYISRTLYFAHRMCLAVGKRFPDLLPIGKIGLLIFEEERYFDRADARVVFGGFIILTVFDLTKDLLSSSSENGISRR